MPALLYLLKTQVALLLLLGVYYGFLRRLTFHQLNRAYLLGSLLLAGLYPALDLSHLRPAAAPAVPLAIVMPTWPADAPAALPVTAHGPSYETGLLVAYSLGVGVLLVFLLVQGASLWRLHRESRPAEADGVPFRAVAGEVSPFSFGRSIYLNPAHHAPAELPVILLHEQVHVRQAHTLDVLLGHLHRALAWASPAAWLWLRAVQENLEFIADATVLHESQLARKQYQYSLVRLSTLAAGPALVTPFSFITLKNRIRMMNSLPSTRRQLLRYAAGFTLLAGLAVSCATPNVAEMPRPIGAADQKAHPNLDKLTFVLDGKPSTKEEVFGVPSKDIAGLHVFKGNKAATGVYLEAVRRDYGSKLDDGILFGFTKAGLSTPAAQELLTKYNIQLADPAVKQQRENDTGEMYQKMVDGKGLTDEEIAGRMIMINSQPATAEQLRALPAGVVSALSVSDGPIRKYGEAGRKGMIMVLTKNRQ
ncbi:M56 family metallopeptidase [Hymenobacter pini]|uniref:M56 family metallopeptidase n=1 Tax=Hymenobacter pini TaxID=2880879 RepID=UPI001CF2464F|nr:M56 family metallopeptidase [Hymenobacter pini]MCA8832483.1 hypothetical protein [Hymenobacter pini]